PAGPCPASTSACRTQLRSAVSVRSNSRATVGTDLPLSRTRRTASALNSSVNARRFRFAMTHSYRTFVRSRVSTKPGQVQSWEARKRAGENVSLTGLESEEVPSDHGKEARLEGLNAYREAVRQWGPAGASFVRALAEGKTVDDASRLAGVSRQTGHKRL